MSDADALGNWVSRHSIPFSLDNTESLNAAIDRMIASLDNSVDLLGFGEALHGGENFLILRNRLFQRLVEAHGYTAIAVESSFPRGRLMNDFVNGRGPESYEAVNETGFSHGFGRLEANRELVELMRAYNADPAHPVKLQFYGFDTPTEYGGSDSPRQLLHFALDYLSGIDGAAVQPRRDRIDTLLGQDSDWENPAATFDASKSIGQSPAANSLRVETEELISELQIRRPEFVARTDKTSYLEAAHYAVAARQLLNYHAALARASNNRLVELLGIRDASMADNLAYMVERERSRGRVLAFAHNSHLKCGEAQWQLGPQLLRWWPAGAHLHTMLGPRYTVVGTALGVSEANAIGPPEPDTLEAQLTATSGPGRFIPTHKGEGLTAAVATLPTRTGSTKNQSYFPLNAQSFTDFDWLAVLNSTTYPRGGPELPQ